MDGRTGSQSSATLPGIATSRRTQHRRARKSFDDGNYDVIGVMPRTSRIRLACIARQLSDPVRGASKRTRQRTRLCDLSGEHRAPQAGRHDRAGADEHGSIAAAIEQVLPVPAGMNKPAFGVRPSAITSSARA